MSVRSIALAAVLWAISLFAVGTIVRAQVLNQFPEPTIVSGTDFGFRVEAQQNGALVGKLVARVNGKWVEAHVGSNLLHPAR
jgi:hypothetical protein